MSAGKLSAMLAATGAALAREVNDACEATIENVALASSGLENVIITAEHQGHDIELRGLSGHAHDVRKALLSILCDAVALRDMARHLATASSGLSQASEQGEG